MVSVYLKLYFGLSTLLLMVAGLINYLVDPLWYAEGNQITNVNEKFNERLSKTVLFLESDPDTYDCLILGNSKVTALNPSWFQGKNCFNYAYDAGKIEEYLKYARFLKRKGADPEIIYVGVDDLSFKDANPVIVPPKEPDPIYQAYASLDIFLFSLESLFQESSSPRFYNEDFEVEIRDDLPRYVPKFVNDYRTIPQYDFERVRKFHELRSIFPEAKYVGFIPPTSSWSVVNDIYGPGLINCYFGAIQEVSSSYDEVVDFSIPSAITSNPGNSYDPTHYYLSTLEMVAQSLQSEDTAFGIKVNPNNFAEYRQAYLESIKDFLDTQGESDRWKDVVGQPILNGNLCYSYLDKE